jgi:hypothetical protein
MAADAPVLGHDHVGVHAAAPAEGVQSVSRTKKQPYRKSRRFDKTCRCHGSCSYCTNNRLIQQAREEARIVAQLREIA